MGIFSRLINGKKRLTKDQEHNLYKKYYRDVFMSSYYILNDRELCKEITNEAYITAFESIDSLRDFEKFKPWICKIALNLAKRHVQKNKKILYIDDFEVLNIKSQNHSPEKHFIDKEYNDSIKTHIKNLIQKLDCKYQEIIYLRYYKKFSYNQISSELNIPINTVKTRIKRAKSKLGDYIKKEGVEIEL